jgi:hypothetical protein
VRNAAYKSQKEKVSEVLKRSASLGMQGSLELLLRFSGTSEIEKLEFHSSWYEMVEQYSTRKHTRDSDKLMAIVGVAALIQDKTALTFVAGLWKETIELNLLWSTRETEQRSDRPVPSWSWASINGEVRHHLKGPEGPGQISQLDVGGATLAVSDEEIFKPSWHNVSQHISTLEMIPTLQIDSLVHNAELRLFCLLLERSAVDQVDFLPDVTSHAAIPALWYMPIISFSTRKPEGVLSLPQTHGLVVRRVGTDVFERVGYFGTADENMRRRLIDESSEQTILFK